jgi:hypothetical protein
MEPPVVKVRWHAHRSPRNPRAEQQVTGLSRKRSRSLESFLNDLAAGGALAYRLSGDAPVNHICVRHLSGSLRVVVAFETVRALQVARMLEQLATGILVPDVARIVTDRLHATLS